MVPQQSRPGHKCPRTPNPDIELRCRVFRRALDRNLNHLVLSPAVRADIEAQHSRLAAAETGDARGRQAINEAFVAGYRVVLWVAAGLGLASSLSAAVPIRAEGSGE